MKKLFYKILIASVACFGLLACNPNPAPRFVKEIDTRPALRFMTLANRLYAAGNSRLNLFDISDPVNPKLDMYLSYPSKQIEHCSDSFLISADVADNNSYNDVLYVNYNYYSLINPAKPVSLISYQGFNYSEPQIYVENSGIIYSASKSTRVSFLMMSYIDPATKVYKTVGAIKDTFISAVAMACSDKNLFLAQSGKLMIYDISQRYASPVLLQAINKNVETLYFQNGILFILGDGYLSQYTYSANALTLLSKIPVAN